MSESPATQPLVYRRFTPADIEAAHGLSTAVGWRHSPADWRLAADTGAGFVAEEAGVVLGTILYWKYGTDRATLGMVIVAPEQQGRGIGRRLMELALDELCERITFLHATLAGQPLYEKLGFQACGTIDQRNGPIGAVAALAPPAGERLRPIVPGDLPQLTELASRACGLDRSAMLPALLQVAQGVVLERGGELLGFSLCRRFGLGYVIGPVAAAHSPGDLRAKALISYWLERHPGEFMRIDTPADTGLDDWLTELGMKNVDTPVKMVRNAPAAEHSGEPDPTYRAYGIINQAMA